MRPPGVLDSFKIIKCRGHVGRLGDRMLCSVLLQALGISSCAVMPVNLVQARGLCCHWWVVTDSVARMQGLIRAKACVVGIAGELGVGTRTSDMG